MTVSNVSVHHMRCILIFDMMWRRKLNVTCWWQRISEKRGRNTIVEVIFPKRDDSLFFASDVGLRKWWYFLRSLNSLFLRLKFLGVKKNTIKHIKQMRRPPNLFSVEKEETFFTASSFPLLLNKWEHFQEKRSKKWHKVPIVLVLFLTFSVSKITPTWPKKPYLENQAKWGHWPRGHFFNKILEDSSNMGQSSWFTHKKCVMDICFFFP